MQQQFDRLAKPYFEDVRARVNRELTAEETKLLNKNVLEELIRERLWVAAARRQGLTAPVESIDARMQQLPFFQEGGKLDAARFQAFKASPTSNYRQVASEIEQGLLLEGYLRWMERRFSPTDAELRKEFTRRTTQATIRYLWLLPEVVSIEPEASAEAIRAYYDRHGDEFMTPDSSRVSYVRFQVAEQPDAPDSARVAADQAALHAARELLAKAQAGASVEEAAQGHGGLNESGWFQPGAPIRGLGRSDALGEAIRGLRPGGWIAEPIRVGPNYVIARLDERREPRLRPFRDVVGLAKRRAETAVREARLDSLARIQFERDPGRFRAPRVTAVAVARSLSAYEDRRAPGPRDIRKALDRLRKQNGVSDTARAWSDSVAAVLPAMLRAERRDEAALRAMREAARRLQRGARPEEVAARLQGVVSRVSLYRGEPPLAPSLVEGALLDSLYTLAGGTVVGPLIAKDSVFVVQVVQVDPTFLPPFEAARTQARSEVLLARQQEEVRAAQAWFEQRREEYRTPERWVFDYVLFRKAHPESLAIPEDTLRAYWTARPAEFTVPGEVKARHILVSTRGMDAAKKEEQRRKAAGILERLGKGEDFVGLAKELSEDRGSATKGGDLGWISKADVVPEFGEAAFALEPGQRSGLVESQFGFHIIQVDEKKAQSVRPFEDCRQEIQTVLGGGRADSLARATASAFAAGAAAPGADFAALAQAHGGANESPPMAARGELPGVGVMEGIDTSIGKLDEGGVTKEPLTLQAGYLVARLKRRVPPALAPFEEVRERVVRDWQLSRRRAVADSVDAHLRASLRAGHDLESLVEPLGGLRTSRAFPPDGPIPDLARDAAAARDSAYLARIFASKPGATLPPLSTSLGTVYGKVDTITPAAPSEFAKARTSLRREVLEQRIETWTARLRARARIDIHRKDLRS